MTALESRLTVALVLFVGISCVGLCLFSTSALAQSQADPSDQVNVSYLSIYSPRTGGEVKGIVLDQEGNPVPDAVVTLWQDGRVWMEGKHLAGCTNPQRTYPFDSINYLRSDGEFSFIFVNRGSFVVTAEKEGYSGSAIVYVTDDPSNSTFSGACSLPVKITLNGYHVPVFSVEQLSYTGAIAGTLRSTQGYRGSANVSLWKDGYMVRMPGNPQMPGSYNISGQEADYLFEHLTPGTYQVVAEYSWGGNYTNDATVNVGNNLTRANIVLTHMLGSIVTPSPTPSTTPAPGPGIAMALLSISLAVTIASNRIRRQ